mmetsp:Transcript_4105/g.15456  ORF Transcript_4105/g.15456 Transcript_4105/m.15456 type:complete len:758 (+) Transcript_4105:164-2437(+)
MKLSKNRIQNTDTQFSDIESASPTVTPSKVSKDAILKKHKKKEKSWGDRIWDAISRLVSITVALPIVFSFLLLCLGLTVWGVMFSSSQSSVGDVLNQLQRELASRISITTSAFLDVPPYINELAARRYASGGWNLTHVPDYKRILFEHFDSFPSVSYVCSSTSMDWLICYLRNGNGTSSYFERSDATGTTRYIWAFNETNPPQTRGDWGPVDVTPNYFPTTTSWWREANQDAAIGNTWTSVYSFSDGSLGITAALAKKDGSSENAVFSVDYSLAFISNFLKTINIGNGNSVSFIVEKTSGFLVGTSDGGLTNDAGNRLESINAPNAIISGATHQLVLRYKSLKSVMQSNDVQQYAGAKVVNWRWNGYFVNVLDFNYHPRIDWLIVVAIPASDFEGKIVTTNWISIGITVAVVLVSLLVALILSCVITYPLNKLGRNMVQVSHMNLDTFKEKKSVLYELRSIQKSFFRMVYALKSFARYLPVEVIKELMHDEQIAEVMMKPGDITVSFVDIEGFTEMSEALSPEQLLEVLSDALQIISDATVSTNGIVEKYIGDCAFSLWNSFGELEDHAVHGVRSLLLVQENILQQQKIWKARNLPELKIRGGLHTGTALVGTFGTTQRLNFSALGDSINSAARLEPLNKIYKTTVLISGSTHERVKDQIVCRQVDRVTVKGKTKPIDVFEPLAERPKATDVQLKLEDVSVKIFSALGERDFEKVRHLLQEARTIEGHEADAVFDLLEKKCDHMENGGDAVTHMTTK